MRGLPFPQDAAFERETSYEYGTPASNLDDIPIDPALADPTIDPALQAFPVKLDSDQVTYSHAYNHPSFRTDVSLSLPSNIPHHIREYSQGPQGDPFAQPPPAEYFSPITEAIITAKPPKKKRKVRREPNCGFCNGNDKKNKIGEPEEMVSCDECGRSGHPTCMDLCTVATLVRSYPWKCVECKTCEICQEKGDDARILFCDTCDRGWHMDCLTPPLQDSPPGKWHCPSCTHNPSGICEAVPQAPAEELAPVQSFRQSSVTSTSCSEVNPPRPLKRGKRRAATPSTSERNTDVPESPLLPRGRTRTLTRKAMEHSPSIKRPQLKITPPRPPDSPPRRMVVRLRLPVQGKGKEKEESSDEEPTVGLFDDILTPEDRDTSKTVIMQGDKLRFERSRQASELKLNLPQLKSNPPGLETPIAGPSSRPLRSTVAIATTQTPTLARSVSPTPSTPGPSPAAAHPTGLRIRTIRFGEHDIHTWYDAPFPEEYANIPDGRLWICEFCLKYNKSGFGASRHGLKCKARHPPGDEIYRDGNVSIFEVDGRRNKIYCQNLCLLSKMFLDHKSLFYDVEPFFKEKRSPKDFNVSCIMTLPVRQRRGWGNLLMEFSYLLSKKEQRLGSPEKPLSGLGALGYKNYWTLSIMRYLRTAPDNPTLEDISNATSMTVEDVYNTLCAQDLIDVLAVPTPKPLPGQSIKLTKNRKTVVARRHLIRSQTNDDDVTKGPFVPPTQYEIHWDPRIKPEKLKWSPFLLARVKKSDADSRLTLDAEVIGSTPDKDNIGPASASSVPETPAPVTPIDADGSDDEAISTPVSHSPEKRSQPPDAHPNRGVDSGSTFTPSRYLRGPGVSGSPPNTVPTPSRMSSASASPSKPSHIPKLHERENSLPIKRSDSPTVKEDLPPKPEHDSVDEDADAALAARLAEEESRPKRLLRSRSGTGTVPTFELPRRRVMSPAMDELPPPTEMSLESGLMNGVTRGDEDVRSEPEDVDTPFTVVTSRHSAPSDDTIVAVTVMGPGATESIKEDTNLPPVADPHAMDVDKVPMSMTEVVNGDLCADVDADGETDADAEGEDDDDLDAEGEPDDGL
ncbi:hypothetical protein H4582DRAFT_1981297 [Lactarius indigo]|nr:hypothetical protein H4582DRAFT_1981297 [Lactarius indigo]